MSPEVVLEALVRGDLRPLRSSPKVSGVSEGYFLLIAGLLGSDPEAAVALGRHWRAVLRYGDRSDYAWRARAGALRASGRWLESAQAFRRSGQVSNDVVGQSVFQLGAVDSLARAGKVDDAIVLGKSLVRRLRRIDSGQAARAALNLGNAYIWKDEYRKARTAYTQAVQGLESEIERAAALLGRSTAGLYSGRLSEAEADALAALEMFRSYELGAFAAQAETNLARIELLTGRPDEAWDRLRRIEPELDALPDRARFLEFLGDTLFALNLYSEASAAFERAAPLASRMPLNEANCQLGLGRALSRLGKLGDARAALERSERLYRRSGNPVWQMICQAERQRLLERAAPLHALADRLNEVGANYAAADAALSAAEFGSSDGLELARKWIRRNGYGSLRWKLEWLTARQSGRVSDYRRMAESLIADRLATRSLAARTAFLRDRGQALREFLDVLVRRGTPSDLDEAIRWVAQSRSAALIDEILSTDSLVVLRPRLEDLRRQVEWEPEGGGARYAGKWVADAQRFGQSVGELILPQAQPLKLSQGSEAATWLDLGDRFVSIDHGKTSVVASECIRRPLKWLLFEMMGPMSLREIDPGNCIEPIQHLQSVLRSESHVICPDGVLWQVPWPVLREDEPVLAMGPQFDQGADYRLPANPRVCIWTADDAGLPGARQEVEILRQRFEGCVVCRSAAEARASLGETWDLIHIACHARMNASNPMLSYFEFSDGPLHAIEIARSSLRIGLATLAACDTARFDLAFPDEPHGIARAFLARGAEAVIASQWPLDDAAACVTIEVLSDSLARGGTARDSLAQARRACRTVFPHPYFWGAPVLIAGYRHA